MDWMQTASENSESVAHASTAGMPKSPSSSLRSVEEALAAWRHDESTSSGSVPGMGEQVVATGQESYETAEEHRAEPQPAHSSTDSEGNIKHRKSRKRNKQAAFFRPVEKNAPACVTSKVSGSMPDSWEQEQLLRDVLGKLHQVHRVPFHTIYV